MHDAQCTISIVVPVFNNEQSLLPLFSEVLVLEEKLSSIGVSTELIFVDDGSEDRSWSVMKEIKIQRPSTKIVKLSRNFGANKCVKAGLQFVTGDAFTALAADLQDPPLLILEMVKEWSLGHKLVVCERRRRSDPFLTKFFSGFFYRILRRIALPDYPSGGFDMLLADKQLVPYLSNSAQSASLPILAFWLGFDIKVLRYDRQEREGGSSGWTFFKKLNYSLDILLSYSMFPLRMFSVIGFLVSFFSFFYGSFIFVNALLGRISVDGFATVVVLLTFFQGLVILMLGLVGEYLWRISLEVSKRPESVVDEYH